MNSFSLFTCSTILSTFIEIFVCLIEFLVKNMQKIAKNSDFFPIFSQPEPLKKKSKKFFFLVDIDYISSICTKF